MSMPYKQGVEIIIIKIYININSIWEYLIDFDLICLYYWSIQALIYLTDIEALKIVLIMQELLSRPISGDSDLEDQEALELFNNIGVDVK